MRFQLFALGAGAFALLLAASAGPSYRLGLPLAAALTLLRWAAYAGLAAAALSLVAAGVSYWRGRRWATVLAVAGLAMACAAAGIPYYWLRASMTRPQIHDISTDLDNPPTFVAVLPLRKDAPNGVEPRRDTAEQQRKSYPALMPLTLSQPPGAVFDRALEVVQELGWRIVAADRAAGRLEATDTTRWFGFKDDVVVRLTPWGSGTRADVRSVSRVGVGDAGSNARRIEDFLARLQAN
jgi:uncharacterized protein (DUF1499 family)